MLAKVLSLVFILALTVWNLINLLPGKEAMIGVAMTFILAVLGIASLCDIARTWIASTHSTCVA